MRIIQELNIKFMAMKFVSLSISGIIIAFCLFYLFTTGITMGIDFAGGHLIHFKFEELPSDDEIRNRLGAVGLSNAIIQSDVNNNDVMIRVMVSDEEALEENSSESPSSFRDGIVDLVTNAMRLESEREQASSGLIDLNIDGTESILSLLMAEDPLKIRQQQGLGISPDELARQKYNAVARSLIKRYRDVQHSPESGKVAGIISNIDDALASIEMAEGDDVNLVRQTIKENSFISGFARLSSGMVSPVVGSELTELAIWAVIYSLAGILAYIWFRFNNRFSIAAIVALVHDVIISLGLFAISGREFNLPIVAAVLTIVGYSLNDTIVIFTRIREMLTLRRKEAKENYDGLLDKSINLTLSRTLLTSLTTLIVVLFLYFMAGAVINDFAFILVVGVLVGTYSSVFIASPVLSIWHKFTGTLGGEMKVKAAK
jgi:preprotein translocase subunit SecF